MRIRKGKYIIELSNDEFFSENSNDNINNYDKVYFEKSEFDFPTQIGIRIFENNKEISSAIIGSIGGGTGIHTTSQIIENKEIIICCSDSIFNLSIPSLELNWKTKADQATCFEIYKYQDSYIIHGEMEISRINNNGEILWSNSGADIFTTINGKNDFELTSNYIKVIDWENREYRFDYNGIEISGLKF